MDQKKIGAFIAKKRKEKGLTQEKLAEEFGISNRAISKWETGKNMPDVSLIQPLCELLDISVNELLNGEENSQSDEPTVHLLWLVHRFEKFRIMIAGLILCNLPFLLEYLWSSSPFRNSETEIVLFLKDF